MTFKLISQTDSWMTRKRIRMPGKGTFYPSEASATWTDSHGLNRVSGACMRASYYRITGAAGEEALPTDAYSEWIFALGKAVEIILVEQWKQMGIWVDNNLEFYDKARNLSGEIDCLIRDPETGELVGAEVKSFYGYNATKQVCGNKSTIARPKTSQMMQTLIYTDQFKEHVSYFKLIYYARDSAKRNEFDIRISDTGQPLINGIIDHRFTLQDIYDRYDQLAWHIENKELPFPDYELTWDADKVHQRQELGEVAKTTFEKWQKNPGKYPIGDWMCFSPDTLVWMDNGQMKEIKDIKKGDTVIGLDGPTQVVRAEGKKNYGKCLKIKPACMLDTTCTEDHEWLTTQWSSRHRYFSDAPFMLNKVAAKDLQSFNDTDINIEGPRMNLLIPILTCDKKVREMSSMEYRLLGYYAAEGCLANQQSGRYYQVWFTIHPKEEEIAQDIIRCAQEVFGCHYQDKVFFDYRADPPNSYRVLKFFSVKFADFIRSKILGKKAHNKMLTSAIMRAPKHGVEEFIKCAHLGDGCTSQQRSNPECFTISTSSRILCNQYQQLLWRLGIPARATYGNPPHTCFEHYTSRQGYHVNWQGDFSILKPVDINGMKFMSTPIRYIQSEQLDEVWDIEVESCHHLFATESGFASNCNWCKWKHVCWPGVKK